MNSLKQILWCIPVCLLFVACGGNPGWDGHKSKDLTEQVAEEACKCVYQLMDEDSRIDVAKIIDEINDTKATKEQIYAGEILKK
ncbi:MAG: hypothetical protein AAF570_00360, partial [Bacteroidota bacterium]